MKYLTSSLLTASLLITGCGGGGGGSEAPSSVTFPSTAKSAEPTIENGQKVEEAVASNQSSGLPTLNSVNSNENINTALLTDDISKSVSEFIKKVNFNTYSLNEVINETEECSNGGSISYSGSGDEQNGGTINLNAQQCNNGEETMNGTITATISNLDTNADEFKDTSVKFTSDYTIKDLSTNNTATISNGSYFAMNILAFDDYGYANRYKLKMTMLAQDNTQQYGLKDSIFYFSEESYNTISMYQTSGRVYIDNLASYVDYDTTYDMSKTPFVYGYSSDIAQSGEARYTMANNSKVKIVAENNDVITYVDADGDGNYELSEE